MVETSLLAKVAWSVAIVLGLSALAERVHPRIAGLMTGAPLGTIFVYFFVGHERGVDYVVQSIPHGLAAFTATLAFAVAYHRGSVWFTRYGAALSTLVSVAVFVAVSFGLAALDFTVSTGAMLTVAAAGFSVWLFRRIDFVAVREPVRFTFRVLVVRSVLASAFVVGAIALASALGPRWAGIMVGFPMTMLPTLLIIHLTYGASSTQAMIRNFPLGMGSIVVYILSVQFTFPAWGVSLGTAASTVLGLVYLACAMAISQARRGIRPDPRAQD